MKFCMVTSFFGEFSFGGDSVYVERLSQALLRRGHEVHVVFFPGAFESVCGDTSLRSYDPPQGIVLHPLNEGCSGILDALWSHQTNRSGRLYKELENLFQLNAFEVIHMHNVSLMGAGDLLRLACGRRGTTSLLTAHDYWWLCPQSLFWKFNRRVCDSAACITCNIRRRVPPQLWRRRGWFNTVLSGADALFFPSLAAKQAYESWGFKHPRVCVLPGLLPNGWVDSPAIPAPRPETVAVERPYIAAAGRMVSEKGFQTLIPLMRQVPNLDLVIAGDGPIRTELGRLSSGLDNVRFPGMVPNEEVRRIFLGARAVIVPSLFPETFGLVVAEALSLRVPVIARRSGAIPELLASAGGGEVYESEEDLLRLLKECASQQPGKTVFQRPSELHSPEVWSEDGHIDRYFRIISEIRNPAEV